MKLNELFDTLVSAKKSNKKFSMTDERRLNRVNKVMSSSGPSGLMGRIHYDGQDPHVVHKTNHKPDVQEKDGYYQYIKYIVDNRVAQDNPFAPRVQSLRSVSDSDGNARFKIKLEKLVPTEELPVEFFETIIDALFNEKDITEVRNHIQRYTRHAAVDVLSELMYRLFEGFYTSRNNNLQKMVNIVGNVQEAVRDSGGRGDIDLHTGNFMFRLGRNIPQLVVVDPLV